MVARAGRYTTASVQGSQVRVYTLPVVRDGRIDAVVQVARSRYFVNAAITRLDQDKLWGLNLRKKEYTECPAHGCPVPPAAETLHVTRPFP